MAIIYTQGDVTYINGYQTRAKEFGYDGCHKIYLCDTPEGKAQLEEYGYDFYPIEDLATCYMESCGLRFISDAMLTKQYITQFEDELEEDDYEYNN